MCLSIILSGCGNLNQDKEPNFSIQTNSKTNIISNADTLNINLVNPKNLKIDSIYLTLDNSKFLNLLRLFNSTLGQKIIKAKVYYDSQIDVLIKNIIVVNQKSSKNILI